MNESARNPSAASEEGRVLVLAPDENLVGAITAALREAAPGAQVDVAHSLEEAQQIVVHQRPDLFVLDIDATYDLGQEFLYDLRTSHPNARAIILTAVHLDAQRERAAGMGAIHFLEKPFPHGDFVTLVDALLHAAGDKPEEKFQGTLSDLHIADIIQLKCMSGATAVLEFTGPSGEKARVFFDHGQVRHATAPGKEGIDAFNEIVGWKGGMISEVQGAGPAPRTIDYDWQVLLMEAVRTLDETRSAGPNGSAPQPQAAPASRKILVIDDSVMLLNFVKEILAEANYEVVAVPTAEEGLRAAATETPNLILLDYVLPDMKGDEVISRLLERDETSRVPVVYMSGFGADLKSDPTQNPNVIGSLNKPFTSELLLKTVESYMPKEIAAEAAPTVEPTQPQPTEEPKEQTEDNSGMQEPPPHTFEPAPATPEAEGIPPSFADAPVTQPEEWPQPAPAAANENEGWWTAAPPTAPWAEATTTETTPTPASGPAPQTIEANIFPQPAFAAPMPAVQENSQNAFFCGETTFFSLNWALHAIGDQKLSGILRCFWEKDPVELLARDGRIMLVTTRDPDLYCSEAPITLVNLDEDRVNQARQTQRETGRPLFITLAQEGLILREPALQLVQHYGQKLFAQLWCAPRVRFSFEQTDTLPSYGDEIPPEEDVDQWALSTLRFLQFQDVGNRANYDPASIPAYTRTGVDRVQRLRLTVAEAQFASQFNGARSIAQIGKNLRLDLKFARLTLFRFLALEIVECWPAALAAKQEKRGVFGRFFGE